jgi:amino acid permease
MPYFWKNAALRFIDKRRNKTSDEKEIEKHFRNEIIGNSMILNFSFPGGYWLFIATAILVITMCAPGFIKPFAKVWFCSTEFMGTYVSKLILFVVFYIVVTPIGLLRRLLKKDTLKLQEYKKGQKSVMDERNKIYKPGDIVKPF